MSSIQEPLKGASAPLEGEGYINSLCMACSDSNCNFKPVLLKRRACGDNDVVIDMKYCGVCHSDLHVAADHLNINPAHYPVVPGHELAGVCVQVGSNVTKFKVGDQVGVGCMVDSCQECSGCRAGEEQNCIKQTPTYNGKNKSGRAAVFPPDSYTLGGYTKTMVVHEKFGILIPASYPLKMAGPVMCAGITMYDPIIKAGLNPGAKIAVIGLGGLGIMGLKIAKAMGYEITAISRSEAKKQMAVNVGCPSYIASGSQEQMAKAAGTFDLIINTIPSYHDYDVYTRLLSRNGKQILLGLHKGLAAALIVNAVTCGASKVAMSAIGGIRNTQAVIDLCDKHQIFPEIEVLPCSDLNQIYTKLDASNDAGVRYVIDIGNTLNEKTEEECRDKAPPTLSVPENNMTLCSILGDCLRLFCLCKW